MSTNIKYYVRFHSYIDSVKMSSDTSIPGNVLSTQHMARSFDRARPLGATVRLDFPLDSSSLFRFPCYGREQHVATFKRQVYVAKHKSQPAK